MRVHRHRLRREDLEDCFSQASLELVAHGRNGGAFATRAHVARAIELRFLSRVNDRRRALSGRSPMQAALEDAAALADSGAAVMDVADDRASVEALVLAREELRGIGRAARRLTRDQRLALGSALTGESCQSFCERSGWSHEKYRKVAQRARVRLRELTRGDGLVQSVGRPSEKHSGPAYEDHSHA